MILLKNNLFNLNVFNKIYKYNINTMKNTDNLLCYKGVLFIVPTPIGNFGDITERAILTLKNVDLIAVENTSHTKILLKHFNVRNNLLMINNYNEISKTKELINLLEKGKNVALVSNAGTPLVNDPGYNLVYLCNKLKIKVIPLPGPCAAITALSASGLPTNSFCFEGFLPTKKKRYKKLNELKTEKRTIIFYESKHRILESMYDISNILGNDRYVVLAREITKIWESIKGDKISELVKWIETNKTKIKGEIVLIIDGCKKQKKTEFFISSKIKNIIVKLIKYMSIKNTALLINEIYGLNINKTYNSILKIKKTILLKN